jgi:environmental stress-induced protein Ves
VNAALLHRYDVDVLPEIAWKNGCGTTRELVCRPRGADMHDFDWRVSIATIAVDAAFSAFPGVERCIVLLQGGGVRLTSSDGAGIEHRLDEAYAPFVFDGGRVLQATLLAGVSTDFNTMTRRGRHHAQIAVLRAPAALDLPPRGLLHAAAGEWMLDAADGTVVLATGQGVWWEGTGRTGWRASPRAPSAAPAVLLVVAIDDADARSPARDAR